MVVVLLRVSAKWGLCNGEKNRRSDVNQSPAASTCQEAATVLRMSFVGAAAGHHHNVKSGTKAALVGIQHVPVT
jgi:hypothetical protein